MQSGARFKAGMGSVRQASLWPVIWSLGFADVKYQRVFWATTASCVIGQAQSGKASHDRKESTAGRVLLGQGTVRKDKQPQYTAGKGLKSVAGFRKDHWAKQSRVCQEKCTVESNK